MTDGSLQQILESAFERFADRGDVSVSSFVGRHPEHAALIDEARSLLERHLEEVWPSVGEQVLHFELLEELGEGRFARVYRARDTRLDDANVVVKISSLLQEEPHHLGRLAGHPNVVRVLACHQGLPHDLSALVMEYVPGRTLAELVPAWWSTGPSPVEVVLDHGLQLAAALEDVARAGTVHRDIKPQNVLVGDDGVPRLLDFNLSSGPDDLVRRGGTLPYTSPEGLQSLLDGRPEPDPGAGDVFGLAGTLYFALTNRHPWTVADRDTRTIAEGAAEVLERQQAGVRPIRELHPHVDRRLAGVIEAELAFDPARRAGSAAAFGKRLRGCRRPWPRVERSAIRRPRRVAAFGLVGLTLIASSVAFWMTRPTDAERWREAATAAVAAHDWVAAERFFGLLADREQGRPGEDFAALRGRGLARLMTGRVAEAVADLKLARAWFKDDPTVAAAYAYALLAVDDETPLAMMLYEELLQRGYRDAITLNNLGCAILHDSGADDPQARRRARECFVAALEIDPRLAAAIRNLADLEDDSARGNAGDRLRRGGERSGEFELGAKPGRLVRPSIPLVSNPLGPESLARVVH